METSPTFIIRPPPPPAFPFSEPPHQTVDFSPLVFILGLIAIIAIPALVYTFFFSLHCPPFGRRSSGRFSTDSLDSDSTKGESREVIFDVKQPSEELVKEIGTECPVCLSTFADGEVVRRLSKCNHAFHASCIEKWLSSNSSCPVCRASVAARKPGGSASATARDDDLQQGLPDAGSLV